MKKQTLNTDYLQALIIKTLKPIDSEVEVRIAQDTPLMLEVHVDYLGREFHIDLPRDGDEYFLNELVVLHSNNYIQPDDSDYIEHYESDSIFRIIEHLALLPVEEGVKDYLSEAAEQCARAYMTIGEIETTISMGESPENCSLPVDAVKCLNDDLDPEKAMRSIAVRFADPTYDFQTTINGSMRSILRYYDARLNVTNSFDEQEGVERLEKPTAIEFIDHAHNYSLKVFY